ncbi:MAG: hypothetical protein AB199_02625 [Parcubacteria bacterium C7867-004]|nr:MAG: hypothetical protein AB199_02625 [Parcubacteria bacterium C7867-004]
MNTELPTTILEALDIAELPAEEREELLLDLSSLISRGTLVRLIEQMDDTTSEAFSKLMDTNPDEEAVEAFLLERVPNADQAARDALKELTDDIVAATKA